MVEVSDREVAHARRRAADLQEDTSCARDRRVRLPCFACEGRQHELEQKLVPGTIRA